MGATSSVYSYKDVDARNNYGHTQLHLACGAGQVDMAKLLIEKGADVNAMDHDGFTPLHIACLEGQVDVIKLLIENGANVNAKSNDEGTPLHFACGNGHVDVAKLLIEKGVDVNAKDVRLRRSMLLAIRDKLMRPNFSLNREQMSMPRIIDVISERHVKKLFETDRL